MSSSKISVPTIAQGVSVTDDTLTIELSNGPAEVRSSWRMVGGGSSIYGPALDEDLGVQNPLAGRASGESQRSFERRLTQRASSGSK